MDDIQYCIENLKELIEIARRERRDMLVYLLELALAEAYEELQRRGK